MARRRRNAGTGVRTPTELALALVRGSRAEPLVGVGARSQVKKEKYLATVPILRRKIGTVAFFIAVFVSPRSGATSIPLDRPRALPLDFELTLALVLQGARAPCTPRFACGGCFLLQISCIPVGLCYNTCASRPIGIANHR